MKIMQIRRIPALFADIQHISCVLQKIKNRNPSMRVPVTGAEQISGLPQSWC